jgi:uncharacterized protein YdaU (DUF1376 family)
MSKDPAFLFYPSDFLVGTLTMPFEDRGKYITLLAYMHQKGRVNKEELEKVTGAISDDLKSKFKTDENGLWYNERMEEEIEKRRRFIESRHENGKSGGRPDKKERKGKKSEQGKIKMQEETFIKFWEMYDKPTEKQSCKLKWFQLSEGEPELIFERLPAYVAATPERQFRKNPLTYLNRKIWLDEMVPELPKELKKSAFELLVETGRYE